MSVAEPEIPGVDGTADWGGERPRVVLVKNAMAMFGNREVGDRYEVIGRPGVDPDDMRVWAFRMLQRSFPDEDPGEWHVDEDGVRLELGE